jgi:large subunit ribosomal protein L20
MRVKGGTVRKRRHNKIIAATKGYRMSKNNLYKVAHEAYMHAGNYAYADRQKRAGQIRRLWIQKINAACMNNDIKYNALISGLKNKKIDINRKVLADIAVNDPKTFTFLVKSL